MFQHTAAWRRLHNDPMRDQLEQYVSTHSRVEAAALLAIVERTQRDVSTHSRVEAAARPFSAPYSY